MLKEIFLIANSVALATAHMQLHYPPPFKAANNPYTVTPDNLIHFPHNCCGTITPMPCRGYLSLLGTPEGASVATWAAGSQQTFSLAGPGGNHYGGSCQIGFSTDQGKSFRVTTSWEGNCPHRHGGMDPSGQQFPFTVPSDLPNGDAIFAWAWINREQEFFMNCAVVSISGDSETAYSTNDVEARGLDSNVNSTNSSSSSSASIGTAGSTPSSVNPKISASTGQGQASNSINKQTRHSTPIYDASMRLKRSIGRRTRRFDNHVRALAFDARPLMLFADVDNGCLSPKTTAELKYPNPGPIVVAGDGEYPLQLPTGSCG